jgi:tetratricopeptide (TPR) repeat protein
MKCLEKQRERRYQTANGLSRDVQRYLANEPVEARPPSAGYRLRKFVARHKGTVAAAFVVLLALVVSVAVSTTAAVLIWKEQKKTEAERVKASENADAAMQVVRDLSPYVERIESSGNQAIPSYEQRKKMVEAPLPGYERLLALHPDDADLQANIARLHRFRANICRSMNLTAEAGESYRESIRHYGELAAAHPEPPKYRQSLAETSRDFGLLLNRIGHLKDGSDHIDQAVRTYQELLRSGPNDPTYQRVLANILIDRADLDFQLGRFPDCEKAARTSVELYAKLAETPGSHPETLDHLFHAMAGNRLAEVLREQGRIDEAVAVHDDVVNKLTVMVKVNPTRDFLYGQHRFRAERAVTVSRLPNRRADAAADLDEAVLGWEKLSKQFPDFPAYLQYQGVARMYRGRLKSLLGQREAAALDLNAAATILAGLAEKYKEILAYRYDLGRTYTALGQIAADPVEADRVYSQARAALEEAVKRVPENARYRQALDELEALTKAKQ